MGKLLFIKNSRGGNGFLREGIVRQYNSFSRRFGGQQPSDSHQFVRVRNQDFTYLFNDQLTRLSVTKSQQDIALLKNEFSLLRNCHRFTEIPLKTALDALPAAATFKDSWSIPSLAGRFDHLKDFAGGLASPFPHTATVESDFSIGKWETDGVRTQIEQKCYI